MKTGLFALILAAGIPATAGAATKDYAPQPDARNFATSVGGWTSSSAHEGVLCLPMVLCPEVTNAFASTDGFAGAGDGYISSEFSTVIAALAGTTIGTWESPPFSYQGVKGTVPTKLRLHHARRSDLTELLGLPSAAATYSVEIVDLTNVGNEPIAVVADEDVPDFVTWEGLDPIAVPANALRVGSRYAIRISTAVATPLAALAVSGDVGYDNIRLRAAGPSRASIARGLRIGATKLAKKKVLTKIRCPKAVAPGKCRVRAAALLTRNGPKATKSKAKQIRGGKRKKFALPVRPRGAAFLATLRRVFVFARVSAAGERFAVIRKVKLKRG